MSIKDNKRINRNDKFCSSVRKKDVNCVLSGNDTIQCEAAHIVPLNGEYGQNNYTQPEILNDSALGKVTNIKEANISNLTDHSLFDKHDWVFIKTAFK